MSSEQALPEKLIELRTTFEQMMSQAWEKYDSSAYESDLEDYGEDYEKAYTWLFDQLKEALASEVRVAVIKELEQFVLKNRKYVWVSPWDIRDRLATLKAEQENA